MGCQRFSLVAALAALLFSGNAGARPWHGLVPGASTKAEVIKKFGAPARELPLTISYDSGLVYQGKQAEDHGANEAQFFFDAQGKLTQIFVFPAVAMRRDDVIKAYGTGYEERRTDDFRLYFQYRAEGFVVFYDKDNESVYQLQFSPAQPAAIKTASGAETPKDAPPPAPLAP